jgi:hypothetical protein
MKVTAQSLGDGERSEAQLRLLDAQRQSEAVGVPAVPLDTTWEADATPTDAEVIVSALARPFLHPQGQPTTDAAQEREDTRRQLALIVLLDQFSRNVHRGSPLAFAYDRFAIAVASQVVAHRPVR